MTSDLQSDSSSDASNSRRSKDADDIGQSSLIHSIKILIRQSSRQILKVILTKVKKYINGTTFNVRAGRIVAAICGYLSLSGVYDIALGTFIDYAYENLNSIRLSKNYESILANERGDIEVSWNFQLLSELTKANGQQIAKHIKRLSEMLNWFRAGVHKELINYIGFCFRNIPTSLTFIIPTVDFKNIYEDENEKEFFSKNLPIRVSGIFL